MFARLAEAAGVDNVHPHRFRRTFATSMADRGMSIQDVATLLGHTNVKTLPYPGFPTDMQPQITTLLALSGGTSMVIESIFDSRFKYVSELVRMGANIRVEGNVAVVNGVESFSSHPV